MELTGRSTVFQELAVPEDKQQGVMYIIPGHGAYATKLTWRSAEYSDMVTIIRDRILDMMDRSMTMEQIKAAKLTGYYDGRYNTSSWTADIFVEAVYRSLQQTGVGTSGAR